MALARNSEAAACTVASGQWLESAPRGAYTTARTVDGTSVFELSFHIERLAQSARLMLQADAREGRPGAEALLAAHAGTAGDAAWLRPRVLDSLRAAVSAYRGQDAKAAASAGTNGNGSCGATSGSGSGPAAAAATTVAAPASSTQQQGEELKLTVLVTWEEGQLDIWSHVSPLPARPRPPVKVAVAGHPRSNAAAKDSEWVRQRKDLEQGKPADVNEVLLSTDEGAVYEGLTSNFFAVVDGAVHTAGEGVLLGSVRHLILEVAAAEGIPVVLRPPLLADLQRWEGAFISSTSRLLLPVDELLLAAAEGDGREPRPARRFKRGGLVCRLEELVLRAVRHASEPLL